MKKLYLLLIAVLVIGTISCRKRSTSGNIDYMIFGTYYGECMGRCANFYELKGGQLWKDTTTTYMMASQGMSPSQFHFDVLLPSTKYTLVQDLPGTVPQKLYSDNGKTLGQPDSHDQGAIAVFISMNGAVYKWVLDPDLGRESDDIATFVNRLIKAFYEDLQ